MKLSDNLQDAFDDDEPDPEVTAELDEEFPLGDGTAQTDASVVCPHCGEAIEITLDPGSGGAQEYVEDCEVCCRPWRLSVTYDRNGDATVTVDALDG